MAYVLVVPPAGEPITVAEAKAHLRVDIADDDVLIGVLIAAARQFAEMRTQRQFLTAQWRQVLDKFSHGITLDKCPVVSVQSIQYLDMSGVWQTVPSTDYVVDMSTEPARITPIFGRIWPIAMPQIGSIKIDFTSGYGDATKVPEGIKSWMKLRIGALYENRSEVDELASGSLVEMPFVDRLLDPYCVVAY